MTDSESCKGLTAGSAKKLFAKVDDVPGWIPAAEFRVNRSNVLSVIGFRFGSALYETKIYLFYTTREITVMIQKPAMSSVGVVKTCPIVESPFE